jgi:hypothetical protein
VVRASCLIVATIVSGCIKAAAFECASDTQCTRSGTQGTCESVGFCSFPDAACASGRRFGSLSGGFANQCVDASDAGTETMGDAPVDNMTLPDGLGCPVGYAKLTGITTTHLYRRIGASASWQSQVNGCKADGANVYLVIPDDGTELSAILTLAGGNTWVGVDDLAMHGTFVTVLGGTATYLPWAAGQPSGPAGSDCVQAMTADTYDVKRCSNGMIAVCECEP